MKPKVLFLMALGLIAGCANWSSRTNVYSALLGSWELESVETIDPRGTITYPFYGRKPQGLLIYDPSGWMSVQIVSDPKASVPTSDTRDGFRRAPAEERAAAAEAAMSSYLWV